MFSGVHPPLLLHILLHLETLQLYPPLPLMFQNLLIGFPLECLVQSSDVCISLVVHPLLTWANGGKVTLYKAVSARPTWGGQSYTIVHVTWQPLTGTSNNNCSQYTGSKCPLPSTKRWTLGTIKAGFWMGGGQWTRLIISAPQTQCKCKYLRQELGSCCTNTLILRILVFEELK